MSKLKRINDLIEGLLGLNMINNANNYSGSSTSGSYSVDYDSQTSSTDAEEITPNDLGKTGDDFLRYSSTPSDMKDSGAKGIKNKNKNYQPDYEMKSELEDAINVGLGNYEDESGSTVGVEAVSVVLAQNNNAGTNKDVFEITVALEPNLNVYVAQELIDSITYAIEDIGLGNIEVLGKFDYDKNNKEEKPVLKFQVMVDR